YAAAYLAGQGWLDALRPHLAQTNNVRLALALVARAETPLGFVYASDVAAQPKVRMLFKPAPDSYPAIRYPMAMTRTAKEGGQAAMSALVAAQDVYTRNGFLQLPGDDTTRCKAS
ncbi:MAG: substrate-binding domain-containing protein, partial [Planktotalea sp.]|uniref:substrate-binding domain-containing protein n=1 Tax=Planktotalea sp. TaxID=2029877 RepID=UPI003C75D0C3